MKCGRCGAEPMQAIPPAPDGVMVHTEALCIAELQKENARLREVLKQISEMPSDMVMKGHDGAGDYYANHRALAKRALDRND